MEEGVDAAIILLSGSTTTWNASEQLPASEKIEGEEE